MNFSFSLALIRATLIAALLSLSTMSGQFLLNMLENKLS